MQLKYKNVINGTVNCILKLQNAHLGNNRSVTRTAPFTKNITSRSLLIAKEKGIEGFGEYAY